MYAATVDNKRFTFQASGSLWQDALVMMDMETESLWSQVTGECIYGPMEGKKLSLYNSAHTVYDEYKNLFPNGMILKKEVKGVQGSNYDKYFKTSNKFGIFGRQYEFDRIPQKEIVFGLKLNGSAYAITKDILLKERFYSISRGNNSTLIVYNRSSETISAFKVEKNKYYDVNNNQIISGRNRWNSLSGKSTSGKAADLESVPVITSFWFAWVNFFPDTRLIAKRN